MACTLIERQQIHQIHHPALLGAEAITRTPEGKEKFKLSEEEQKELVDKLVSQNELLNQIEDSLHT